MTQTATNPQTGETVALIGSEWKPVSQTATNKAGAKAYLVGDKWHTDEAAASPSPTSEKKLQTGDLVSSSIIGGVAGLAGLPGDALRLLESGITSVGDVFGLKPKRSLKGVTAGKEDIIKAVEKATGTPLYKPESDAGRYVGKAIEGAVSMPGRAGTMLMGAASGAGGEIGGDVGGTGGAVAGALLPFVAPAAAAKTIGFANDALRSKLTDIRAGKVLRDVAGDKREQILAAMAGKGDDLTAAQAASDASSTRWSALGDRAAKQKSEYFKGVEDSQAASRMSGLENVKPNLAEVEAARTEVTRPLYSAVRGQPGRIDTSSVVSNIDDILTKNPGNDELVSALSSIKKGLFDQEGNLRTNAEQVMSVIDGVKAKLANRDNKFIVEQLVGVKEGLKGSIPGATKADEVFREMSGPVNQSKVITALQDVLTNYKGGERVQPYLNVLGRGEKALLKTRTGAPRYEAGDIDKLLTATQRAAKDKVAEELIRDARLAELSSAGSTDVAGVLSRDASKLRLPMWLNRYVTAANKGLDIAEDALNAKTMEKVYEAMKTGKSATEAMNQLPTSERNKVLKAMIELKSMPKSVRVGQEITQGE